MERKCKGSLLLDMVKVVRAFRDLPWERHLFSEDLKIVNSMVLPTAWYPIESYQRIGMAVYQLVAKGEAEVVRNFGRAAMEELFKGPYRPFLDKNNPVLALRKFLDLRKHLFNFSKMELIPRGGKSVVVKISELGNFQIGLDVFLLLTGVHFQRLAELNGGREVDLKTRVEAGAGGQVLFFELSWR